MIIYFPRVIPSEHPGSTCFTLDCDFNTACYSGQCVLELRARPHGYGFQWICTSFFLLLLLLLFQHFVHMGTIKFILILETVFFGKHVTHLKMPPQRFQADTLNGSFVIHDVTLPTAEPHCYTYTVCGHNVTTTTKCIASPRALRLNRTVESSPIVIFALTRLPASI